MAARLKNRHDFGAASFDWRMPSPGHADNSLRKQPEHAVRCPGHALSALPLDTFPASLPLLDFRRILSQRTAEGTGEWPLSRNR
jgi:hypothetical protein